jgi:hypothetical protein
MALCPPFDLTFDTLSVLALMLIVLNLSTSDDFLDFLLI